MKIIVPATSANLGAGFDSIGLAVNLYLTIEVLEKAEAWRIDHDLGVNIPTDEKNLLLTTLSAVLAQKKQHLSAKYHLKMSSDIPLARGLGSSSSVIIAGIELANQLAQLGLSDEEKLALACQIEGHPDNVAPALYGNLVIASSATEEVRAIKAKLPQCKLLAFIPDKELKTVASRQVLPETLSYAQAVAASAVANVLVASLLSGDLVTAGQMMQEDLFHEKYRSALVPELAAFREIGQTYGAYGTYLSGAGPTLMMLAPEENITLLLQHLSEKNWQGRFYKLEIDSKGLQVEKSLL